MGNANTASSLLEWGKKHKTQSDAPQVFVHQTEADAKEFVAKRINSIAANCVQRSPSFSSLDPIIEEMKKLEEYELAEHNTRIFFNKFVNYNLAEIYKHGFGWRRFFMLSWWKFKFSSESK